MRKAAARSLHDGDGNGVAVKISRLIICVALASVNALAPAFSQSLTTIQDTLFKADGTRFNGSLTIQWNTFDATNLGTVVQQSRTVPVVNGNLYVQLAPNSGAAAPANVYTVLYQSDGKNRFAEKWTVPASSTPLKVASVRTETLWTGTGTTTGTGTGVSIGAQTPIQEADVIGLLNDLDQRPLKGSGFGTGRVAIVNQNGEIETAVGDVTDCVHTDGSTGACGGAAPGYVDAETPGGVVDGSNNTFTLAAVPSGRSLQLFRNGLYMTPNFDYMLVANTVQFVSNNVPQPADTITASYRVDPVSLGIGQLRSQTSLALTIRGVQVICSATGTSANSSTWSELGYCNVPLAAMQTGDRLEVRFALEHTGQDSAFDVKMSFGNLPVLQRHGGIQDAAFAARSDVSVSDADLQFATESYGTVLPMLPGLLNAALPTGDVRVAFQAQMSKASTTDRITLRNYTVLRYPAN